LVSFKIIKSVTIPVITRSGCSKAFLCYHWL